MKAAEMNPLDRVILYFAPQWALARARARLAAAHLTRHYEAASGGWRTASWPRSGADANVAALGAIDKLRAHARDLVRNNGWARRGLRVIRNNTVGWGIMPSPLGAPPGLGEVWKAWCQECDADERLDFHGLQGLVMRSIVQDGEVLIRRRRRRARDGYSIPLQLQVLEADFLDTARTGFEGASGGPTIQGVEFDKLGKRSAYWLFENHPGSSLFSSASKRVPASEIIHVFLSERPGQVRGVSWFAPAIITLKDFDEFEDAELMRQKIAACFTAFVQDPQGEGKLLEEESDEEGIGTLEPGRIEVLPPGKTVEFGVPPLTTDNAFSARKLRRIAAALGVTYEDLTGDYSNVNFSSARLARLAHWSEVRTWQWDMLIPQFCTSVWSWAMEAAQLAGHLGTDAAARLPTAEWTPPPMPMHEPDREGLALMRLVRAGAMTHDQMVREQGYDPVTFWPAYAAALKRLDELGIKLDSDVRAVTQAGLAQTDADSAGADTGQGSPAP
jgi:lambda family phage portal protein